jgi:hypothetical protein
MGKRCGLCSSSAPRPPLPLTELPGIEMGNTPVAPQGRVSAGPPPQRSPFLAAQFRSQMDHLSSISTFLILPVNAKSVG